MILKFQNKDLLSKTHTEKDQPMRKIHQFLRNFVFFCWKLSELHSGEFLLFNTLIKTIAFVPSSSRYRFDLLGSVTSFYESLNGKKISNGIFGSEQSSYINAIN